MSSCRATNANIDSDRFAHAYADFLRSFAREATERHVVDGVTAAARMIACAAVNDLPGVASEMAAVTEHSAKAAAWRLAERRAHLVVIGIAYREARRGR